MSGQKTAKEIPPWTEKCDQSLADRPGIITGVAVERRRRNLASAAHSGKKCVDLAAMYFQPSTYIARHRMLVGNPQCLPRTPLSGIAGIKRNLTWLQQ